MLASWRTFEDYELHQNGHVSNLCGIIVYDNDDSKFHTVIGSILTTQRDKTPEGMKEY